MSLEAILLGLLERPMSGYDLKKEFESGLVHIWSVNLSQIYPTLKKMADRELVQSSKAASDFGPARVIYQRTDKGHSALCQWLRKGPIYTSERLHELAQAYFLHELDDKVAAIKFFEDILSKLRSSQHMMEGINTAWRQGKDDSFFETLSERDFYPYLTLDLGLRKNKAKIEWCQDCVTRIKKRMHINSVGP